MLGEFTVAMALRKLPLNSDTLFGLALVSISVWNYYHVNATHPETTGDLTRLSPCHYHAQYEDGFEEVNTCLKTRRIFVDENFDGKLDLALKGWGLQKVITPKNDLFSDYNAHFKKHKNGRDKPLLYEIFGEGSIRVRR